MMPTQTVLSCTGSRTLSLPRCQEAIIINLMHSIVIMSSKTTREGEGRGVVMVAKDQTTTVLAAIADAVALR